MRFARCRPSSPPLSHLRSTVRSAAFTLGLLLASAAASAVVPRPVEPFTIDPATVQRDGPAYRYPQEGWTFVHIEGAPYERGYQHGTLLSPEIAAFVKCYAQTLSAKNPGDAWRQNRTLVDSLFVRKFDHELLEEMHGIADGASAAGAKFEGRPLDLTDIVAINVWAEIMCLDSAARATPTGLEGHRPGKDTSPSAAPTAPGTPQPSRCSAFAATGPATKDGKVVIGHITMFDLYPSNFSNVMLDIKPAAGHRVLIQTCPGGVQSGLDWYQNDAGIVLTETTISQTAFDPTGMSVGSRSRMAVQYADTIEGAVDILLQKNNGLYTNEWLLADTKTNDIAMLELGTRSHRLWRSSKGEWFGGTEGFYWGCNNTKDESVRLDTLPAATERPSNAVFTCEARDCKWVELYKANKGKIDAEFGRMALSTPPLLSSTSADAKVTTTDLNATMSAYAIYGTSGVRAWRPSDHEKSDYPEVRLLPPNPWTQIKLVAPPEPKDDAAAVDLGGPRADPWKPDGDDDHGDDSADSSQPLYHGTLLPAAEADIWLAGAFASYHDLLSEMPRGGARSREQREDLALKLRAAADKAAYASRTLGKPLPPSATSGDPSTAAYHDAALSRGLLILHALHERMGEDAFVKLMDDFGTAHAGKPVTTESFISAATKAAHADLVPFFRDWLDTDELPRFSIANVTCAEQKSKRPDGDPTYAVRATVTVQGAPAPDRVAVTVETEDGNEITDTVKIEGGKGQLVAKCRAHPARVIVDKYYATPHAALCPFEVGTYQRDLEHTLIVYGTDAQAAANAECARDMAESIRTSWANATVPVISDMQVTDDQLRSNHVLLIGAPRTNRIAQRFASAFPVEFGPASVKVGTTTYAHADTSIVASGENPLSKRYGFYLFAGLSTWATYHLTDTPAWLPAGANVVVFPKGGPAKPLLTFDPSTVKVYE
jgi:hypothetical protein